MNYHAHTVDEVLQELKSHKTGLSEQEVNECHKKYGYNGLPHSGEKITRLKTFLSQFKSPLIVILVIAGIVSGALGEVVDMTAIFITVAINTVIGFIQEDKANQALKKLHAMIEYKAVVMRGGRIQQIKSEDVAFGDILIIEAGDKIQADGRIIVATDFETNEAALTGESEPNKKHSKILKDDVPLADRENMVYRGSIAVKGRATVVVTGIGADTEIGKIATLVKDTVDDKTPLQVQLSNLSRKLAIIVLFISSIIFLSGVFLFNTGESLFQMFELAVAISVAAIPEGLVISLTVILAVGMRHILKRRALVRKLVAAETLGSVSVICTDKTGTITEGKMNITNLINAKEDLDFEELKTLHTSKEERHKEAIFGLRIGVLCNDGVIENSQAEESKWKMIGDTTDLAFLNLGAKINLHRGALDEAFMRLYELPFTSERKYMATMHHIDEQYVAYIKGAPEVILKRCKNFEDDGKTKLMTKAKHEWFHKQIEKLTDEGLRVIAVAYKHLGEERDSISDKDVTDLNLVCLVGLSDPVREGVNETIKLAHQAGIKTVMITGDHIKTARTIAKQIGLSDMEGEIFDGQKLEQMTDEELALAVPNVSIFARVDPIHKIRIVRAYQTNGEIVAMTGDGVNDAPALKAADIGIALGSGSDVAKEIADMVLLDDSYNTIVAAVEQGRGIYQNVKKVLLYLLASSFAEVGLVAGCIIARLPLAVLPAQILWVNIIEDSFPNMALSFDRGDKENMNEKPRKKNDSILDKEMKVMIAIVTIVSNAVLFGLYIYFLRTIDDFVYVRTLMFVGLGIASLIYIYSVRSMRRMVWQTNPINNMYLNLALFVGWALLISAVHFHPFQALLRTVDISLSHWGIMFLFGFLNLAIIEIIKWYFLNNENQEKIYNI